MAGGGGVAQFLHGQLFETPPIPQGDLSGKTIIVTGGNAGLGLDCCKHLVRLRISTLIIACRNATNGEAARKAILATGTTDTEVLIWSLDLSNYASVLAFGAKCNTLTRLDGIIENAGVLSMVHSTAEDNETTITVNVVSTFLLALLVLPKLRETAQEFGTTPRIAVVGSFVHVIAKTKTLTQAPEGRIFETINDPTKAPMADQYNLSKLLNLYCVRELAAQLSASNSPGSKDVIVNCVHPGYCRTGLFGEKGQGFGQVASLKLMGRDCEVGSRTLVDGVLKGRDSHGQYLGECQVKSVSPFVKSEQGGMIQLRVWKELMAKLQRIHPGVLGNI